MSNEKGRRGWIIPFYGVDLPSFFIPDPDKNFAKNRIT
jgi:hypothetical protein